MDRARAAMLLNGLSEAMGFHPETESLPNLWRVRDDENLGWIMLQPLGTSRTAAVARFPVYTLPEARRGDFCRALLELNMEMAGVGSLALSGDGDGVWSLSSVDLSITEDPNALSGVVTLSAHLAEVARDELADFFR